MSHGMGATAYANSEMRPKWFINTPQHIRATTYCSTKHQPACHTTSIMCIPLSTHLQVEDGRGGRLSLQHLARVDCVDDGARMLQLHTPPHAVLASRPSGVDQPGSGAVLLHLLAQHGCVLEWVPHEECAAKAGRKGGLGLSHAHLRASHLHRRKARGATSVISHVLTTPYLLRWQPAMLIV